MTNTLQPYSVYKDSSLPWLGRVPEHWGVRRAKYVLRERDERWSEARGTLLRVSQYTRVTKRRLRQGTDDPDTRSSSLVGYKVVCRGDLVVNVMLAWNGSLGVAPCDGVASPAYCVYSFAGDILWHAHYLLRCHIFRTEIKRRSRGVVDSRLRLYTDDLFKMPLLLPPRKEQDHTVRYLRHVDHKVTAFIRNRRRLIEVFTEQKQAIINRAVTRGLDPNVPLKSSGIDWLGDIPAHWEVRRLSTVCDFRSGKAHERAVDESGR